MYSTNVESLEKDLFDNYKLFLEKNDSACIAIEKRLGSKFFFSKKDYLFEGEAIDDGYFQTKLNVYFEEGKELSYRVIHESIMSIYVKSGLIGKKNAILLLDNLKLTQTIYSPENNQDFIKKRGIIATIKYQHDGN